MSARLGKVEINDVRQETSPAEVIENVARALEFGYVEISELEFQDKQLSYRMELESKTIEPIGEGEARVPWDELVSNYRSFFKNNPAEFLVPEMQIFCVHDEPVHLEDDLILKFDSLAPTAQSSTRNLIFKRGLSIDGNLDAGNDTTELPLLVIVEGDLNVKNLFLSCWVEVIVTGNVIVADTLFCFDGEVGGRLHVEGNLSVQRVLGAMMYPIEVVGQVTGDVYWIENDEPALPNALMVPGSVSKAQMTTFENQSPLVKESYYLNSNWATGEKVETYDFSPEQVVALIRQGKPIFR